MLSFRLKALPNESSWYILNTVSKVGHPALLHILHLWQDVSVDQRGFMERGFFFMKVQYRWCGSIALGMMILLLFSACVSANSSSQTNAANAGKTQNASTKTAQQVFESSVTAMKQLKTTHFEMSTVNQVSSSNPSQPATTMNLKNTGDLIFPDQLSMQLNIGQARANPSLKLAEIETGQKIYIQNAKGKWFVLDNAAAEAGANPLAGANVSNYNNLLTLAEKAKLTDNGNTTMNGVTLRHITATFSNDSLHDLLTATGQLNALPAPERAKLEQALKNAKLQNPELHVWIDEATSYVHRLELKFIMNVNNSTAATKSDGKAVSASVAPSTSSTNIDTTIDYSKFNEPVKIVAPGSAVSTSDVAQIFQ
jgi:hypothetical protein